ncbi:translesion DNA synthesis-associated protein ImuA [Acidovorax sp. NCPPB 2350]|nr:translesion DNA synthesis-associated protein ImuA [Acidovorax sp. NCPPB 2350]
MAVPSSALLSALPAGRPAQGGARAVVEVPGVWRGASLDSSGMGRAGVEPSGHAALDAQLPGGGWPRGAMSEVLLPDRGLCEWPLVLPALARATARRAGQVVLVAPPHEPFVPVLHAAGLRAGRLCRVEPPADARDAAPAWACEQALRCRDVLAVLAWLPRARPDALRRLQLAAAQQGVLLWVFRAETQRLQASPAPLRLWVRLQGADERGQGSPHGLRVHLFKRRGAPLLEPVVLPAHGAALEAALAAGRDLKARRQGWGLPARGAPQAGLGRLRGEGASASLSMPMPSPTPSSMPSGDVPREPACHALDRAAIGPR